MEPWLGVLHLVGRDAQAQTEFEAIAAVYCKDRQGYEAAARGYAQSQGYQLLWAEDMHPAGQWIAMYPQHRGAANIARAVHGGHLIELGPLRAVGAEGEDPKEAQYLTITEHEIEPLPDQSGIPFWDREWIAPDLKELLFAQPQEGPAMNTYFIVDATLRKNITGFFDLDGLDVPIKCLFKGDAAQELKTAAPYLIDMTLPEGAWDDKSLIPDFHKDFFKKHWGQNTGIFLQTSANMQDVRNHFRKFTKVQLEADKRWVFFRFWDPRIAPSYFDSIKVILEKSAQWVKMRGSGRIERIIGNQTDTEQPWSMKPTWEKLEGITAIGNPVLSDVEMKGFEKYKLEKFLNSTYAWILENYPTYYREGDDLKTFIRIQVNELVRRNIGGEYALVYIIAGCFLLRCYVSRLPNKFQAILDQQRISQKDKSELFLKTAIEFMEQRHDHVTAK